MLPVKRERLTKSQARLLEAFEALSAQDQVTLLTFAEFLGARAVPGKAEPATEFPEPRAIPRPAQESVVAAMRRLSATYHMLDRSLLLHQASGLMSAHVMQGKVASEVIDELEVMFRQAYDQQRLRNQC